MEKFEDYSIFTFFSTQGSAKQHVWSSVT